MGIACRSRPLLLLLAVQAPVGAGMATRRWRAAAEDKGVVRFDFSALPRNVTVVRADLLVSRTAEITGSDEDALVDVAVFPIFDGRQAERPLVVRAPWSDRLDATGAARKWAAGTRTGAFVVKTCPRWHAAATCLDIAYEGEAEHIYDKPRGHRFYLLWADPPLSHVPDYYHLGVTFPPGPPKEPRPLYVQAFWWDNGWARSGARRAIKGCVSLQMETPWVLHKGIHEGCGTYKARQQGSVQDYWVRRLRNILPWLEQHYKTDPERTYAMSSDWAWHHPDLFAAVHENLTTNPRRSPTAIGSDRYWGSPKTPARTEWGISAWDYYDIAGYLKTRVDLEIPLIYYTPNMHEGDFGFIDKPRFYRAMLDTRRAFVAAWHMNVDASWVYTVRRADTLAAFSNCSLDADPGIGMGDGDREGQINGYLLFDPTTRSTSRGDGR